MVVQGRVNRIQRELVRMTRREMFRTGTVVAYTPRTRCSCQGPNMQPQVACRRCDGFGWYWRPEQERRVRVILQDIRLDRRFKDYGAMQQGDLTVTFDRAVGGSPYDRVRLDLDQLRQFDIAAEDEIVEHNKYGDPDRLTHNLVIVRSITQTDPRTGVVTDYREGRDFTVVPGDNTITWLSGITAFNPDPGANVAVSYYADYEWICMQPPAPRHVGSTPLPAPMILTRHARDERINDALAEDVYA